LQSGRDLTLSAGRDVNTVSSQVADSPVLNRKHTSSDVTQISATVSTGRDLSVQAGRDITAIPTQIDAKRDIAIAATENVTIASAANEDHYLSKSKKLTIQEDHVHQVSTEINAGGSVALSAGQNLAVISSRITAGDEAYLVAGDKLDILAAQDSDYSLYNKKSKGSFGRKKTKRDEVTHVTNIGSEITSGGNMMLVSGGDEHYQVARLESGKDLTLDSVGAITFEGVKDLHQESHEKSNSSLAWTSMSGKGRTDETLRQSELIAKGNLAIKAVDGLHIDVKQVNRQTVSQAIDAMVKADPDLAWLKDAEKRGDVDWKLIKETHDSYKYSHSGLGQGAMLAIIITASVLTAGAALLAVRIFAAVIGAKTVAEVADVLASKSAAAIAKDSEKNPTKNLNPDSSKTDAEAGAPYSHPVRDSAVDLNAQASLDVGKVTAPIDFDGHILSAELKQNGDVVGGHSIATGEVRVIADTVESPNAQGVYKAKIEVADPANPAQYLPKSNNGGFSTMFPDSWSADRVKDKVDEAFKNKTVVGNRWNGVTPSGVKVSGWLSPKTTVFPFL